MESGGNSSSMQSSSCGEEDSYDSRAAADPSMSALFNHHGTTTSRHHHHNHHHHHVSGPTPNPPPPPPPHPPRHHLHHQTHFDPLCTSDFFDLNPLPSSTSLLDSNSLVSLHPSDLPPVLATASAPTPYPAPVPPTQQLFITTQDGQAQCAPTAGSKELQQYSGLNYSSGTNPSNHNGNMGLAVRNPKKRSRASRRAPTTVLTTDTTNFRAMVQEFTGIPSPPFPRSATSAAGRFDLFGTLPSQYPPVISSSSSSSSYSNILRPFAQKPLVSSAFLSSPFSSSLNSAPNIPSPFSSSSSPSSTTVNINSNIAPTTSVGFELPDFQGFLNMNTLQNHNSLLNFQPPRHPLPGQRSAAEGPLGHLSANQFGGPQPRDENCGDDHQNHLLMRSVGNQGGPCAVDRSQGVVVGNGGKTAAAVPSSLSMDFNGDQRRPESMHARAEQ